MLAAEHKPVKGAAALHAISTKPSKQACLCQSDGSLSRSPLPLGNSHSSHHAAHACGSDHLWSRLAGMQWTESPGHSSPPEKAADVRVAHSMAVHRAQHHALLGLGADGHQLLTAPATLSCSWSRVNRVACRVGCRWQNAAWQSSHTSNTQQHQCTQAPRAFTGSWGLSPLTLLRNAGVEVTSAWHKSLASSWVGKRSSMHSSSSNRCQQSPSSLPGG